MATTPAFAANPPYAGRGLVSPTANLLTSAPGASGQVTIYPGAATGCRIKQIDLVMLAVGLVGDIIIWAFDGTNYWNVDTFSVTTLMGPGRPYSRRYSALFLNPAATAETLTCTSTVASQPAEMNVYAASF